MLLMLLLLYVFAHQGKAQSVPICEGEEFNLQAYLVQNFPSCSVDSIQIVSSTIPGVTAGVYQNPFEVLADGEVTVELFESGGTLCSTEAIQLDLVEANFTATAVQGSCLLVDLTPPTNTANCSYTYILGGDTVPGPLSQYQFSNGGLQTIRLNVQCGSCVESQQLQIDVDGPIAGLNLSAPGLFFDPDFGSFVLCTEETTTTVQLIDISQQINSATTSFSVNLVYPDGSSVGGTAFPDPFEFIADQEGLYSIEYEINDNGCVAQASYELFVSNPNVSTQLEVPVTVEPFACEDETYDVNVCPNGCPTNPPGTVYEVILECTEFFFSTTEVPVVVPVPLNIASCGSSCTSGGGSIACSCDLVVRAIRPCANAVSNTICPFQIQPLPNANFNIIPFDLEDTYCAGSSLSFDPTWISEDCNGANPALSICEIQNPVWNITPSTGWSVVSGGLDEEDFSAQFTQPGEYTIDFNWSNDCGDDSHSETICVLPADDPPVSWFDVQVYCVGQTIDPTVNLPNVPCIDPEIEWSGDDVAISDPTSPSPLVTFTETGTIQLDLEIEGLCNDFSASTTYTVCDEPEITLSQVDLELCVGQEFCFDQLISLQWNNCVGDVTWEFDSLPGSPIVNPTGTDLCFTWNDAEEFELYIEAANDCGTVNETITVTVVEAPSCPHTTTRRFLYRRRCSD